MTARCLVAALAVAVSACGAPGSSAEVGGAATYFVPPRGPASTYAVADVSWSVSGGEARLDYTLPRLLVGASARVSFRGPLAPDGRTATLTGALGSATCTLHPSAGVSLRCDEHFSGLRVDLAGVRDEAARVDPTRVDARVEVARAFSIEPIGVLEAP